MDSLRRCCRVVAGALFLFLGHTAFAGFASTETYLPAVGRIPGLNGAQFYTTVWATNLTGVPVTFTFDFLKNGQANTSPANFQDTLSAGQTKMYENVVESKLGLTNALGAARVTSSGEILLAERIYDQAPGDDLGKTVGLFFAGVPKTFSIVSGQSASIQGINQGGSENFRYNFALIETGGGSPTVNVQVFDGNGTMLGQKAYPMQPYEQLQPGVADVVPGFSSINARITATVTGGSGSMLLAGAQLANESQDSSGFEMSFRDDILGSGGGTAGVTSLNGLTGALTIAHGANTTVNVNGKTITIDAVAGSGTGLTAIAHDNSLTGSGTVGLPLAIGNGQVVRSLTAGATTLHDAVTLAAGSNVTITPSGNTFTIAAAAGGGGGLNAVAHDDTLQGDGTGGTPLGVKLPAGWYISTTSEAILNVQNASTGVGITGQGGGIGVLGFSSHTDGTYGETLGGGFNAGVHGNNDSSGVGVYGQSNAPTAYAVYGNSNGQGYAGYFDGKVHVQGSLEKPGGSFKIDHPLDPAHKYLSHSFVESPDMKNIYDGVVTLDSSGTATVNLPAWFGALNRDFRYQLTAMDTPQPSLYVSRRVRNNEFQIAGGAPGAEVSWMLTGIRQDAWANAHRIPVEEIKPEREQGTYLEPALFGEPEEKSVRALKERAVKPNVAATDR